jgi:hypothetical protein
MSQFAAPGPVEFDGASVCVGVDANGTCVTHFRADEAARQRARFT